VSENKGGEKKKVGKFSPLHPPSLQPGKEKVGLSTYHDQTKVWPSNERGEKKNLLPFLLLAGRKRGR